MSLIFFSLFFRGNARKTIKLLRIFRLFRTPKIPGKEGKTLKEARNSLKGKIGSAKTDPVRFKWGFGEGLVKDKFVFFEASEDPIPKRRKLLTKRPFLYAKGPCLKPPLN